VDWRAHPPARLEIGAVLHPDDAVANKLCALYSRGEVRDYIDVDGILSSGRYERERLLDLAVAHDPGFDRGIFAEALAAVRRLPDTAFAAYALTPEAATRLRDRLVAWSSALHG
jgi:hypothetical protein